jgi:hypothetical protein
MLEVKLDETIAALNKFITSIPLTFSLALSAYVYAKSQNIGWAAFTVFSLLFVISFLSPCLNYVTHQLQIRHAKRISLQSRQATIQEFHNAWADAHDVQKLLLAYLFLFGKTMFWRKQWPNKSWVRELVYLGFIDYKGSALELTTISDDFFNSNRGLITDLEKHIGNNADFAIEFEDEAGLARWFLEVTK